jgi:hypothetical protein
VQNARLHERTNELRQVLERTLDSERRAAHQLRGLFEISHAFTRSLSLEATLDAVAKAMVEVFGVDARRRLVDVPDLEAGDCRELAREERALHRLREVLLVLVEARVLDRERGLRADRHRRFDELGVEAPRRVEREERERPDRLAGCREREDRRRRAGP